MEKERAIEILLERLEDNIEDAAIEAERIFAENGYTWYENEKDHTPTKGEIVEIYKKHLVSAFETLWDGERDFTTISSGRLFVYGDRRNNIYGFDFMVELGERENIIEIEGGK